MLDIKLVGDRQVIFDLKEIQRKAPGTLREIVKRSGLLVERRVKRNLTNVILNVRTGRLRRSIATILSGGRDNPVATVGTNVIYAPVHEFGATIRARNVPYLRFPIGGTMTGRGGQWVSVKQVTIPPRPFMKTSFEQALPGIHRIAEEEIERLIA